MAQGAGSEEQGAGFPAADGIFDRFRVSEGNPSEAILIFHGAGGCCPASDY